LAPANFETEVNRQSGFRPNLPNPAGRGFALGEARLSLPARERPSISNLDYYPDLQEDEAELAPDNREGEIQSTVKKGKRYNKDPVYEYGTYQERKKLRFEGMERPYCGSCKTYYNNGGSWINHLDGYHGGISPPNSSHTYYLVKRTSESAEYEQRKRSNRATTSKKGGFSKGSEVRGAKTSKQ